MNNWISVKDRLPEEDMYYKAHGFYGQVTDWYLAYNNKINIAYMDKDGDWVSEFDGIAKNVTHWQPLPELPEGE